MTQRGQLSTAVVAVWVSVFGLLMTVAVVGVSRIMEIGILAAVELVFVTVALFVCLAIFLVMTQ